MASPQESIWEHVETLPLSPALPQSPVDVAVIGAGVAGITTAYVLAEAGYRPLVIEADRVGAGMTGRSTAHISAAVDGGWRKMVPRLGPVRATQLARAYRQGIYAIHKLATGLPDSCDFAWIDGELIGLAKDREVLNEERDAAASAGLDVGPIQNARGVPDAFSIRFARQGRLHPLKYVDGLARSLVARGVRLARGRLKAFHATNCGIELLMDDDQIVVATAGVVLAHNMALDVHYPGVDISRRRSYVIAAECTDHDIGDTITWDLAHPYHYTRLVHAQNRRMVMVGGADHAVEKHVDADRHFAVVEEWMRARFPTAGAVRYRWYGDLKQTSDNLAILGRMPGFDDVYVLDGDTGLGINHAMIGAHIVRDLLGGRATPNATLFSPSREARFQPALAV